MRRVYRGYLLMQETVGAVVNIGTDDGDWISDADDLEGAIRVVDEWVLPR